MAVAGVASATIPSAGGSYTACQSRAGGVLRMIDPTLRGSPSRRSHCVSGERKITWSRSGSTGRTGVRGRRGAAGAIGAPSAPGVAGLAGPTGPTGGPGASGPAGNPGAAGPSGSTGITGPSAVSAYGGHVTAGPSTSAGTQNVVFGAPVGLSIANTQEAPVDALSPSTPITVQNLDISETGPPVPAADQIVVSVYVNGSPSISCVVLAGATSCNTGAQSASVPAGSTLSIGVQANASLGATIFPFEVLFGFEAT